MSDGNSVFVNYSILQNSQEVISLNMEEITAKHMQNMHYPQLAIKCGFSCDIYMLILQ